MTGSRSPHRCRICAKKFSQYVALQRHLLQHSAPMPFVCTYCGKRFSQKCNMKRHVMLHTGEKPFNCKYCAKGFTQKGNLERHITIHTGDKPYACHLCDKAFTQSGNLKLHLMRHTGERPFVCHICFKRFSVKGNLQIHLLRHTNDECFVCEVCNEGFLDKDEFIRHTLTHDGSVPESKQNKENRARVTTTVQRPSEPTVNACRLCDKQFSTKFNLDRHLRQHRGDYYECSICNHKFNHPSNFKRHLATHTDEKPYECDVCHKKFSQKAILKRHIITHCKTPEDNYGDLDNVEHYQEGGESAAPLSAELCGDELDSADAFVETYYFSQSPDASVYVETYENEFTEKPEDYLLQSSEDHVSDVKVSQEDKVHIETNEDFYKTIISRDDACADPFQSDSFHVCDQCGQVFMELKSFKKHSLFHSDRPTVVVFV